MVGGSRIALFGYDIFFNRSDENCWYDDPDIHLVNAALYHRGDHHTAIRYVSIIFGNTSF